VSRLIACERNWGEAPKELQHIVENVIVIEGGYSDNPNDPGGATKYGVTERVARSYGYEGEMADMPMDLARWILYDGYVTKPRFDTVHQIAGYELAAELIDSGINCGQARAAKWLQESLNAISNSALVVDGDLGSKSFTALTNFIAHRKDDGKRVLTAACNSKQGVYYMALAERDPKFRTFVFGWLLNRVVMP
jgi:lysozyme family protein